MIRRPITAMTEGQLCEIRARITGKADKAAAKPKQKRTKDEEFKTVSAFASHLRGFDILQLPLYIGGKNRNKTQWSSSDATARHVACTWKYLTELWDWDETHRSRIQALHFVRIAPKTLAEHDALPGAFAAVCDATCAWIELGELVLHPDYDMRTIGFHDDRLLRSSQNPNGRIVWIPPTQMKSEATPRAYGVQIRLQLTER